MEDELRIVSDLALILISAGIFTIISRALKQPLVLGYILAGFLVGPKLGLFVRITDTASVEQWSEIGIIFMMFALGLEFSFKKLLKVGSSALIIAGCKFFGLFIVGFGAGTAMGWTVMESVFLGGLLSMSSTAVVIKAYDDMGLKNKPFAPTVFGTLVIEDIIAILLMVVFSTVAVAGKFSGGEMVFNLVKLAFFLILWFLVGIYLIPLVLRRTKKWLNDEILLIVSIGLCFGMVAIANAVNLSSALGAFVMGSILAETLEGEHILKLTEGIKTLFSAVFFVSVGMMIDPAAIAQHWLPIFIITILVIAGHIVFAAGGALLAGKGLSTAVATGFSLSQLGEFGFILAGVGTGLGVMRDFTYPVIVAVSVITTFTTPYMIRLAGPFEAMLRRRLPGEWTERLDAAKEAASGQGNDGAARWKEYLKHYFVRIVLYSVVIIALLIASRGLLVPLTAKLLPRAGETWLGVINALVTVAVLIPFVYGVGSSRGKEVSLARELMQESDLNRWTIASLIFLRILLAVAILIIAVAVHIDLRGWVVLLIFLLGVPAFMVTLSTFHRHNIHLNRMESRFLEHLDARESEERRKAPVTAAVRAKLSGEDIHLEQTVIDADSSFIGRPLKEIPFRSATGVSIVKIERGSKSVTVPGGDEVLYPGDRILAVGNSDQLEAFRTMVAASISPSEQSAGGDFVVEKVTVGAESLLAGNTLKEADLASYGCMVICTRRGEGAIVSNPGASYRFLEGDTVWIAGSRESIGMILL